MILQKHVRIGYRLFYLPKPLYFYSYVEKKNVLPLRKPKRFKETLSVKRAAEYVDVAIHSRIDEKKSKTDGVENWNLIMT